MSYRPGDTTATAGYDARWPLRAYRVALHLHLNGPRSREGVRETAPSLGLAKSLVEDTICAMENDGIVEVAALRHLTLAERRQTRGTRAIKVPRGLRLSPKGVRFVTEHRQDLDAGACPCVWCADLADVRAWVAVTTPEERERILRQAVAMAAPIV